MYKHGVCNSTSGGCKVGDASVLALLCVPALGRSTLGLLLGPCVPVCLVGFCVAVMLTVDSPAPLKYASIKHTASSVRVVVRHGLDGGGMQQARLRLQPQRTLQQEGHLRL